jgi:hypothetical protein
MKIINYITLKINKAMVRAKFNVTEITRYGNNGGGKVILYPVIGNSDENKKFWKYTPSGKIELHIDNVDIFDFGEYYIDFSRIE